MDVASAYSEEDREDLSLMRQIKQIVNKGYDVEVKKAKDGKLKALKCKKQIIEAD